jgi:phosphoglycolate phosphatase
MTAGPAGLDMHAVDLVIFDKDGTLIDFSSMWSPWAQALAEALRSATGRAIDGPLFEMLGYDAATRTVRPGGGLAATPMARLRERTRDVLIEAGVPEVEADRAVEAAWHAPDPVELVHPLADLVRLVARLHAGGSAVAIATSDDRGPTERTLVALGLSGAIDAMVCADDGVPLKPNPDMVLRLCAEVGVAPARTAVVGDAPADLRMGRSARTGLVVGVLTGVGTRDDLEPLADVVIESIDDLLPEAEGVSPF